MLIIKENEGAGRALPVAHAHWLMGRVHLIRGAYNAALEALMGAMKIIDDPNASIRIGLDAIQALLLNERHEEAFAMARALAADAVALDRREPSRRHGLTSRVLAYLREAAQRQALTADLLTECARYLDRIARQPPVEFVPPMPLTEM